MIGLLGLAGIPVSTHSRPKAAGLVLWVGIRQHHRFNTQPPEGGWSPNCSRPYLHASVSTHSRPKAAGPVIFLAISKLLKFQHTAAQRRLGFRLRVNRHLPRFQHTAARRRLELVLGDLTVQITVSTHSRPKAAGRANGNSTYTVVVSTHSRPKAAGTCKTFARRSYKSFNTQPPEGGWVAQTLQATMIAEVSTHSRPKAAGHSRGRGGWFVPVSTHSRPKAAGRRQRCGGLSALVSTHSRPKAAGSTSFIRLCDFISFNTQPPEGGWNVMKRQS